MSDPEQLTLDMGRLWAEDRRLMFWIPGRDERFLSPDRLWGQKRLWHNCHPLLVPLGKSFAAWSLSLTRSTAKVKKSGATPPIYICLHGLNRGQLNP